MLWRQCRCRLSVYAVAVLPVCVCVCVCVCVWWGHCVQSEEVVAQLNAEHEEVVRLMGAGKTTVAEQEELALAIEQLISEQAAAQAGAQVIRTPPPRTPYSLLCLLLVYLRMRTSILFVHD